MSVPICLSAALAYASRGWHVFPAFIDGPTKKSHKSAAFSGGRNWGKTTDPEEIKRDFARWPDCVGIATGAESGIWVVEADTKEGHDVDGVASLRALEEKHGPLPETLMAMSPSGSVHRYFKYPKDREIRNTTSRIAPGVDVRGEGGMVIAPPSVRSDGSYVWLNNARTADAPEWLVESAIAASGGSGNGRERAPSEEQQADPSRVAAALAVIPNDDLDWESWNRIGMATYAATGGSTAGFAAFDAFSQKSQKYDAATTIERWHHYSKHSPDRIGAGTIFYLADEASPGWEAEALAGLKVATNEEFAAYLGIDLGESTSSEAEQPKSESASPKSKSEPAAAEGIPLMITRAMCQELKDLGFTPDSIRQMRPEEAWRHIRAGRERAAEAPKTEEQPKAKTDESKGENKSNGGAQPAEWRAAIPVIDISNWDNEPVPQQEWAVANRIPIRTDQPPLSGPGGMLV
jgi:hypothetical protein